LKNYHKNQVFPEFSSNFIDSIGFKMKLRNHFGQILAKIHFQKNPNFSIIYIIPEHILNKLQKFLT